MSSVRQSLLPCLQSMPCTEDSLVVSRVSLQLCCSAPMVAQPSLPHLCFQVRWSRQRTYPFPPTTNSSRSRSLPHSCWSLLCDDDSTIFFCDWTLEPVDSFSFLFSYWSTSESVHPVQIFSVLFSSAGLKGHALLLVLFHDPLVMWSPCFLSSSFCAWFQRGLHHLTFVQWWALWAVGGRGGDWWEAVIWLVNLGVFGI